MNRTEYKIIKIKDDWRLSSWAQKKRLTGSDKLKICNDCGEKKVEFSQKIRYKNKSFCTECKSKHRYMKQ